ncbi:MAG: cobalt ABC transporter ATP-binding protein, partial [Thermoleophilia bacterium]|nr:cobalt ABC transporter ATP-binding protein [Thermoleophilia bacterium]
TYEMCQRALVMAQGRIVADGPIDEILFNEELLAAHDLELPHFFAEAETRLRRSSA